MASDFWAGYISGAIGIIIGNPLDVIKVQLQAGQAPAGEAASASAATTATTASQQSLGRFESASSLVRGSIQYHKSQIGILQSGVELTFLSPPT